MEIVAKNKDTSQIIPYSRQWIDDEDVAAVVNVLRSDWLTTGPKVAEFEQAVADFVNSKAAVAVSSGTAALHAAIYAAGIGPRDEVIVTPMTFAATVNCIVYQGGTPVFADVDPDTLLIDPVEVENKITPQTKAIIAVDYAGQPCDYDRLRCIADEHGLKLIADACHSLGAACNGRKVGALADLTVFSFHPVKHITTGEGGMITTNDLELAEKMRCFRNHGITTDHRQREMQGSWFYEMVDLGFNYRISDFQCALGVSQLRKLPSFLQRRQEIATLYDNGFSDIPNINPLKLRNGQDSSAGFDYDEFNLSGFELHASPPALQSQMHAYHLYVVRINERNKVFSALRDAGIGVNVHYIPVHLHPFYRKMGYAKGICPVAEKAYENIISLPIWPRMDDEQVDNIIRKLIVECQINI